MAATHPLVEAFEEWSPKSKALNARARKVFPGGDTRASAHFSPYPLTIERAAGCRMVDADGHELIDFMNNFTSLIHGHAHPDVVAAVSAQVATGTAYAAPSRSQVELAEIIAERVPSIDQLRFCSSGSEATLMAIRCARAVTGRQKIMKMEGGYHGSYELAEVSLVPIPGLAGALDSPNSVPIDASIPESVLGDTVVCPYNQPALAEAIIRRHADDLAAVIVEPVLGSMGMVPATPEFLQTLRRVTAETGVLMILDEVITLRLGFGGAQQAFGIEPDLTSMGKIIGGGLPIGAVGGSRELMDIFSPDRQERVFHASTFSGNALSMAAGRAAMQALDEATVERLNELGSRLREGFDQTFAQHGIKGRAIGMGSLSNIVLGDGDINDARDSLAVSALGGEFNRLLHLTMLRNGVASASRLMYCVSTPMDEGVIDAAVSALSDALGELRPHIERDRPALLT